MGQISKRIIKDAQTTKQPLGPLTGGRLAKSDRAASTLLQQDLLLGHGRRIVAATGLHLSPTFSVPSVNPVSFTQVYPSPSADRVVDRKVFTLTPGHMLMCQAVYVPAGETNIATGGATYVSGGRKGIIYFEATFDNGIDTSTQVRKITCQTSANQYGGETTTAGAMFGELHRAKIYMAPDGFDFGNATEAARWSENVTVTLTIYYRGGVRPVDVVVYEVPRNYARDITTDEWHAALYADNGGPSKTYPSPYPVQAIGKAGHTGLGATAIRQVATNQRDDLGPMLFTWSAWTEGDQSVTATETAELQVTWTTFTEIINQNVSGYDADGPGCSLVSGANARRWDTSDPYQAMRGNDAVVPVRVRVYARGSGAGSGTIRVMSADYSGVPDITVTGGSWQWYTVTGHLRCGLGAEDISNCNVQGKVSALGVTMAIRYVSIEYVNR